MLFIQSNQPIVCPVDKALWLKYLHPAATAAAKSLQSCPTLCDPIDSCPSGSPVPGILQARTLEWVAISFSNEWKWKVKVKSLSRVRLPATPWTAAHQAPPSMDFPGKSTGVGCHCLLRPSYYLASKQGFFLHCFAYQEYCCSFYPITSFLTVILHDDKGAIPWTFLVAS